MSITRQNLTLNSEANYCRPVSLSLDRSMLEQGVIRGYAARFDEGFAPGAFKASLDAWRACGTLPHMTWNGDPSDVVGKWTSILEDATGLLVTGKITTGPRGNVAKEELRKGIDGLSAFIQVKDETGRQYTEVNLTEVSLMREAAIPAAQAQTKSLKFQNSREFEGWLRDQGVAKAAARKLAAGGWQKLTAAEPETPDNSSLEALSKALSNATFEILHWR